MLLNNSIILDFCYTWLDFFYLYKLNITGFINILNKQHLIFYSVYVESIHASSLNIIKFSIYFWCYFYLSFFLIILYILIIYNKIIVLTYFSNILITNKIIYVSFIFNNSFIYNIKFFVSILILIFIRAGIPRYRYDFLTKLGWIKFFVYTLLFFIFIYSIFILM